MGRSKCAKLFVTKFPSDYEERDLRKMFEKYGRISSFSIKKGYAFLEFDDYHDAQDAINGLDGKVLEGDFK